MTILTVLALLGAFALVFANGFFVAAEFALVKVRRTQLETESRRGDAAARRAAEMTTKLDQYLSSTQLGITIASLALGWIGEPAFESLIRPPMDWVGVESAHVRHAVSATTAFLTISILHIVVGELAPKSIAIRDSQRIAKLVSLPLRVFTVTTYPFQWVLNQLSDLTLRLLRYPPMPHAEGALSAEEIGLVVGRAELDERKRGLLERVLRSTDRPVRAVMVPRVDVEMLSLDDSPEVNLRKARDEGFSRFPLVEGGDPDKVVGYVYLKDLLLADGMPPGGLTAFRRDVLFVPESRTVSEVLEDFQRKRIPIAIVVDEYGGTAGIVTMEDIVEEIVGELQDEHDFETPSMMEQEDGSILADGRVPVGEAVKVVGEIDDEDASETLGGYLVGQLRRLPRVGDRVRVGSWDASVVDVRRRRVTRVKLVRRAPSQQPPRLDDEQQPKRTSIVPPDGERRSRP